MEINESTTHMAAEQGGKIRKGGKFPGSSGNLETHIFGEAIRKGGKIR